MSAEEKTTVATDVANPPSREHEVVHGDESNVDVPLDLPAGWKYRQISLFGYKMPWYASPRVQLLMVAFVCFMCPGMFNALGGLGGGGRASATLADNMVSHANNPPLVHLTFLLTLLVLEHRPLQRICCLRILWWHHR